MATLSGFKHHFNIGYTGVFNRKYNRSGHLYQGRYKSFLLQKDEYLKEVDPNDRGIKNQANYTSFSCPPGFSLCFNKSRMKVYLEVFLAICQD